MPVHPKAQEIVTGSDPLPTAEAVARVKAAAVAGATAELAGLPWPPGPQAHKLVGDLPLLALALLEATVPEVAPHRLARCLGLDPVEGVVELANLRASGHWPARAFRAAMHLLGGDA